jgi:hypothetical protein
MSRASTLKKWLPMMRIYWNIRSLGRKGRKQCIIDIFKKYYLDFIGIQETKTMPFSDRYLDFVIGMKQFCWNLGSFQRVSWRDAYGVNVDVFEVKTGLSEIFQ